jgi:PAS domain S-box-containing protein
MAKNINSQKKKFVINEKVEEIQELIQLLQIHQIELEHQNEELRETQQELEISRNRYILLFDLSPIPYFILDKNSLIKDVNISGSKILDIVKKRLINKNISFFIPQKERYEFGKFINSLFDSHEKQTCEITLINKNKKIFEVIIEGIVLEDNIDEVQTCQIAIIDFTNQKKFENSLMNSEKKLIASNDSKDRFFSILAHDLRSPFQSLLSMTDYLAKENKSLNSDEISELCNGLNNNLMNLYDLLNNLLRWTMIQRDLMVFNPIICFINKIIKDSLEVIRISANNKKITIKNNVNEELKVRCDIDMFKLVINNLITNSVKFTPIGGEITIDASEKEDYVEVSISDNGIGIDKNNIDKIFNFTTPYSTEGTKGEKGTGLGLALCKEFIEKNGGRIWFNNNEGQGTKFSFTLPIN